MIRPYCKLEPGMALSVELKRGEQLLRSLGDEWRTAREQFEGDEPEAVDVRPRVHRRAVDLLGRPPLAGLAEVLLGVGDDDQVGVLAERGVDRLVEFAKCLRPKKIFR